jgi:hypothetical protein
MATNLPARSTAVNRSPAAIRLIPHPSASSGASHKVRKKYIRRGTHRSTRQLEEAIKHYVKVNNADPKPFNWSKTADDILASVERFCLRTSNSRL